jgi:hypothetical protein
MDVIMLKTRQQMTWPHTGLRGNTETTKALPREETF